MYLLANDELMVKLSAKKFFWEVIMFDIGKKFTVALSTIALAGSLSITSASAKDSSKPIVIPRRKYEASLDYVCANVWPNPRWRP